MCVWVEGGGGRYIYIVQLIKKNKNEIRFLDPVVRVYN